VEEEYGSKIWTKMCKRCLVKPWEHKQYTSVRVQFCKEYYGVRLQFVARAENYTAATEVPIVIIQQGNSSQKSKLRGSHARKIVRRKRGRTVPRNADSVIPVGAVERSRQEPARFRQWVVAPQQPISKGNPLKRKRKSKVDRGSRRSQHSSKHGAQQTDFSITESKTDKSNPVDYALAKQLCSLQKKAHVLCKSNATQT